MTVAMVSLTHDRLVPGNHVPVSQLKRMLLWLRTMTLGALVGTSPLVQTLPTRCLRLLAPLKRQQHRNKFTNSSKPTHDQRPSMKSRTSVAYRFRLYRTTWLDLRLRLRLVLQLDRQRHCLLRSTGLDQHQLSFYLLLFSTHLLPVQDLVKTLIVLTFRIQLAPFTVAPLFTLLRRVLTRHLFTLGRALCARMSPLKFILHYRVALDLFLETTLFRICLFLQEWLIHLPVLVEAMAW